MDFCFREFAGESLPSDHDFVRLCPFLRNINEPTNFSFTSSLGFSLPVRGGKGPIFEDGPNFDTAFRLFHGREGVVPLSGRLYVQSENSERGPPAPQFNPLAAKAATISLSGFGGGLFGFDAFSDKWKNQKKKSDSKGGTEKHESSSNEWLQKGNCPIAKSYRAVINVVPLVAKVLQPPPGLKLKCPEAIVIARAAISRTAFAKNLRPQPLPAKILVIGLLGMAANVPLGIWREHTKKFSPAWFAAVHAAVPFIGMLRKCVLMPKTAMAFTIGASVLGQVIGARAERYRLKAKAAGKLALLESSVGESKTLQVGTVNNGGKCGDLIKWDPLSLHVGEPACAA
ncbi:hypothetical protein RND81_08G180000 [Saponaria officinalis]|uniref:Uncharacterized protein n=1 Tax=Saponaria officinalis TaxID=3572 RepID=A0AAW1J971_SAPOF